MRLTIELLQCALAVAVGVAVLALVVCLTAWDWIKRALPVLALALLAGCSLPDKIGSQEGIRLPEDIMLERELNRPSRTGSSLLPPFRVSELASATAPVRRRRYFYVVAVNSIGESDPSIEVSTTAWPITLTWDYPYSAPIDEFRVYYGIVPGKKSHFYSAGDSLFLRLPPPPILRTNLLLTGLIRRAPIYSAPTVTGPWKHFTNAPGTTLIVHMTGGSQFFRSTNQIKATPL